MAPHCGGETKRWPKVEAKNWKTTLQNSHFSMVSDNASPKTINPQWFTNEILSMPLVSIGVIASGIA